MILLEEKNFEDAPKIAQNDPIVEIVIFRYKLFVLNLAVLSENIVD